MSGYCNLVSSPRVAASGAVEETKWEGVAVGAATLVKNLSSASQRFTAVDRSRSTSSGGGGLQAVVRRAFSMRRQPSSFTDGYWRIHDDMDGDEAGEDQEQAAFEEGEQKRGEEQVQVQVRDHATGKKEKITKKKGRIFKACKKLLGFSLTC